MTKYIPSRIDMYKSFYSLIVLLLLSFEAGASYDNVNPIMQFIIGSMYIDSATTSCQEVVSTPGAREEMNQNIHKIFSLANQFPRGMGGMNIESLKARIDAIFEYCHRHTNDMLATAMIATSGDVLGNLGIKNKKKKGAQRIHSKSQGGYVNYQDNNSRSQGKGNYAPRKKGLQLPKIGHDKHKKQRSGDYFSQNYKSK